MLLYIFPFSSSNYENTYSHKGISFCEGWSLDKGTQF